MKDVSDSSGPQTVTLAALERVLERNDAAGRGKLLPGGPARASQRREQPRSCVLRFALAPEAP